MTSTPTERRMTSSEMAKRGCPHTTSTKPLSHSLSKQKKMCLTLLFLSFFFGRIRGIDLLVYLSFLFCVILSPLLVYVYALLFYSLF